MYLSLYIDRLDIDIDTDIDRCRYRQLYVFSWDSLILCSIYKVDQIPRGALRHLLMKSSQTHARASLPCEFPMKRVQT